MVAERPALLRSDERMVALVEASLRSRAQAPERELRVRTRQGGATVSAEQARALKAGTMEVDTTQSHEFAAQLMNAVVTDTPLVAMLRASARSAGGAVTPSLAWPSLMRITRST